MKFAIHPGVPVLWQEASELREFRFAWVVLEFGGGGEG